jgi:hypothetical protein
MTNRNLVECQINYFMQNPDPVGVKQIYHHEDHEEHKE